MMHTHIDRFIVPKHGFPAPQAAFALIASLVPAVIAQDCDRPVYPQPMYQVGDFPTQVEQADVNGDGIGDILTLNRQSRTISVLLGEGSGAYEPQFGFFAGLDAIDMQLADFDGDGDLDLVVLNRQNVQVSYFANPGDGSFANRVTYPLQDEFSQTDLYTMTIDDLDGDGDPDLLVPRPEDDLASVLWNNGSGAFTLDAAYEPVVWEEPTFIARVDIDLDGDIDFVTASGFDGVCTYLNNGDGTYADAECAFSNGADVAELIFGDLNADGLVDIVSLPDTGSNEERIAIFMNDGTGGFTLGDEFFFSELPVGAAMGDLDQDGDPDLIVGVNDENGSRGVIAVLSNNGDGVFEEVDPLFEEDIDVGDVKLIDEDGDGLVDLLFTRSRTDRAALMMGRGDGGFVRPDIIEPDTANGGFQLFDADSDGLVDLVSSDRLAGELLVLISRGDGTFETPVRYIAGTDAILRQSGDLDLDGDTDVIIEYADAQYGAMFNDGNGAFGALVDLGLNPPVFNPMLYDYTQDGVPDLLGGGYVFVGDGSGAFGSPIDLDLDGVEGTLSPGDLNNDGFTDFMGLIEEDDGFSYATPYLNNGDNSFTAGNAKRLGLRPFDSRGRLGDLDLDGDLDYVTVNQASDDATLILNDGSGHFSSSIRYVVSDAPQSNMLMDYDVDGDLDIVTTSENTSEIVILVNDGNAGFSNKALFSGSSDSYASGFGMGDINGSGFPDILVDTGSEFTLYLDQCVAGPACPADLNADGDLNFFDVSSFLTAYGASEPVADFNGDGQFNFFDVTAFIVAFNAGCP
ncbi:MAG: FG-GAP-like repeat-containing protein [Phycisphaerales bacterium]